MAVPLRLSRTENRFHPDIAADAWFLRVELAAPREVGELALPELSELHRAGVEEIAELSKEILQLPFAHPLGRRWNGEQEQGEAEGG